MIHALHYAQLGLIYAFVVHCMYHNSIAIFCRLYVKGVERKFQGCSCGVLNICDVTLLQMFIVTQGLFVHVGYNPSWPHCWDSTCCSGLSAVTLVSLLYLCVFLVWVLVIRGMSNTLPVLCAVWHHAFFLHKNAAFVTNLDDYTRLYLKHFRARCEFSNCQNVMLRRRTMS